MNKPEAVSTIYDHELAAYRREAEQYRDDVCGTSAANQGGANLTRLGLGLSNRANMILVGMCGLVESLLTELAVEAESQTEFRLVDIRGMGRMRLQTFLTRTGALDFDRLEHWSRFGKLYQVRNVIVHEHGGLVPDSKRTDLKSVLDELGMDDVLVGDRRIRMNHPALMSLHSTMEGLVKEILEESSNKPMHADGASRPR